MEYKKCLVELDEILSHLEDEELSRIPYEVRQAIAKNKDKSYVWEYDETKSLNEQNINRNTIAMLSYLNMEYLLDEEQKKLMEELHRYNEKVKSKKYELDNGKENKKEVVKENKEKEVTLVEVKNEKWYKKVVLFIKNIFTKA